MANITAPTPAAPTQLPIRGEKRIIPSPVDPDVLSSAIQGTLPNDQTFDGTGTRTQLVEASDFNVKAALSPYVDYVIIRILNRGASTTGQGSQPLVYHFLINPTQCQIQRQTLDGQAFARGGWQIGVWGEDSIQINLSGKSCGQYWAFGRTDAYQPYTESYRNLEQLQIVFENNGYWFEGEQANEGPLAANFTRRRIKMHQDVELIVGNFDWFGMFDTFTITQNADEPWLVSFSLSFVAWKEKFLSSSPYQNSLTNNVQRGHSYTAWASSPITTALGNTSGAATTSVVLPPSQPSPALQPTTNLPVVSPAAYSATQDQTLPEVDPCSTDYVPMANVLNSGLPQYTQFWNGGK